MIYDKIENHALYEYNDRYRRAFEYILNYEEQPVGKYDLGDGVIALVQDRASEPLEKRRFETHEKYADIQYLLDGVESPRATLNPDFEVSVPYNEETDVTFFAGMGKDVACFVIKPGYFTVYYPDDYHMPIIGDGGNLKKIVMKVLLDD